ncbi:MAG: hypothetical protein H6737_26725 [Alphaproteobacteria bacterium]|nr:hypothetical protein [Alphaproteobacteria bacterium]
MRGLVPLFLIGATACKPAAPTPPVEADADADTDTDADTDADADTDSDVDTDTEGCADDALEPNDDLGSALPGAGGIGLVVCDDFDDFWSIEVAAGEQIDVSVVFEHALGDLDVRLLDASGTLLDESESTNDLEQVGWLNDTGSDTTVYLRVWVYTPGGSNTYQYSIERSSCSTDPDEPNDSIAMASTAVSSGQLLVATNEDFFAYTVADQELLSIDLVHDPGMGDIDVELQDAGGTVLDASRTGGAPESVAYFNDSGAETTVYLRVFFWASTVTSCNAYEVVSTLEPLVCTEDSSEPNDTLNTATDVTSVTDLALYPADVDWFSLSVAPGQVVEVAVGHDPDAIGVDLVLQTATQAVLATGNPAIWANDAAFDFTVYARVSLDSGYCGPYTLDVIDRTPDCTPDLREDDDDADTAGPEEPGTFTVDAADADWFAVEVPANSQAAATLAFDAVLGEAMLEARDPSGSVVAVSSGAPASVGLLNPGAASATFTVGVVEADPLGACLPYTIDFVHQACGANDAFEPNDTPQTATAVGTADALLDAAELDHFALGTVQPGETLVADVAFLHALGDIDVRLIDSLWVELDTSLGVSDGERVEWTNTGPLARVVILEVRHAGSAPACSTPYALSSSIGVF